MKQKGFFSAQPSVRPDQKGMASIVIVSVLIVILTLVSIGFARLMNRAITNSTDKELGVAANYAAQSGINSGIGYLQKNYVSTDPGALLNTGCSDLIGSTGALYSQANLSGEAGGGNVKYTCLTIDPEPTDLVFGGQDPLPPYKSEVIKLTTASGPALGGGSLMFAWSGTSGHNSTIAGTSLYDETTWSNKTLAPVLRVTLYPLANSTTPIDNAAVQAASRTYFFYPNTGNTSHPNNTAITPVNYATATEPLQGVQCGNEGKNGFDTGNDNPADYTCSVIISGLPADGLFYARMTPLYDSTNLRIQGNDNSGKLVKFVGVQAIVDSTAKANTSSKRLRARVDLGNNISPSDDAIPEFAADSANTICKRLDISDVTAKIADPYCLSQLNIQQPVPAVTLSASPTTIFVGQPTQLTWTSANVTACTSTWTGGAVALSDNQTEFPQVTTTYTINCTGPFGSANQSVTVAVNPILSFYTDNGSNSITIPYNTSTTLHWTITGQADWCYGTGGTGSWVGYKNHASGDNSTATGLLTSPQTYHLYCGNSTNNYQTPTKDVNITVRPAPNFSFTTDNGTNSITIPHSTSTTLHWASSNVDWCWGTGAWGPGWVNPPSGGTAGTGNLTSSQTYYLTCGQNNTPGTTQTVTITVKAKPPPQGVTITQLDATTSSVTWSAHIQDNGDGTTFDRCVFSGGLNKTIGAWGQFDRSGTEGGAQPGQQVTLTCYAGDGASGSLSAAVPAPQIQVGIYDHTSHYDPNLNTNYCGDTTHIYVVCLYFTWTYSSPYNGDFILCYGSWEGKGQLTATRVEQPSGGADELTVGFSNIGAPSGVASITCNPGSNSAGSPTGGGPATASYQVAFPTGGGGSGQGPGQPPVQPPPPPPPPTPCPSPFQGVEPNCVCPRGRQCNSFSKPPSNNFAILEVKWTHLAIGNPF